MDHKRHSKQLVSNGSETITINSASLSNIKNDSRLASTLLRAKLGMLNNQISSNISPEKINIYKKTNSIKSINDKSSNNDDQIHLVNKSSINKHSRKSSLKSKIDLPNNIISSSRKQSILGSNLNFIQQRGLVKANHKQFNNMINLVNKKNNEDTKKVHWKTLLNKFLENNYVLIFMTAITIFSLFGGSLQSAFFPSTVDFGYNIVQIMLLSFFSLEIILSVLSKENYLFSFFFWLDVIATISIIQDIDWIFDALLSIGEK